MSNQPVKVDQVKGKYRKSRPAPLPPPLQQQITRPPEEQQTTSPQEQAKSDTQQATPPPSEVITPLQQAPPIPRQATPPPQQATPPPQVTPPPQQTIIPPVLKSHIAENLSPKLKTRSSRVKHIVKPSTAPPAPPTSLPTQHSVTANSKTVVGNTQVKETDGDSKLSVETISGHVHAQEKNICQEKNNGVTVTKSTEDSKDSNSVDRTNYCTSNTRTKHSKSENVSVKRKTCFPITLCCGLRSTRTDSPLEIELPLRTEGASWKNTPNAGNIEGNIVLPGGESESKHTTLKRNIFESINSCNNIGVDTELVHSVNDDNDIATEKPIVQNVKIVKHYKSPTPHRHRPKLLQCDTADSNQVLSTLSDALIDDDTKNKRLVVNPVKYTYSGTGNSRLHNDSSFRKVDDNSKNESQSYNRMRVRSQSVENLSCVVVDLDLDLASRFERNRSVRSSFVGEDVESKPPIFQAPGEFQTLLKHSKLDSEKVYALPQPHCYGETTLKAVKRITEKYDTLQRWKLRAMSFREGTLKNSALKCQSFSPYRQVSSESSVVPTCEIVKAASDSTVRPEDLQQNQCNTTAASHNTDEIDTMLNSRVILEHQTSTLLKKKEIRRIETFYKSRDTEIYVCKCTADLMFCKYDPNTKNSSEDLEWEYKYVGVPILLLNTGNGIRPRELTIVFAHRHTSFVLWQDKINYLSKYTESDSVLHTMHLSSSHMQLIGIKFHSCDFAKLFFQEFKELTQNNQDDLWKVSCDHHQRKTNKSKNLKKNKKVNKPVKGDISHPLNFSHVTNIDAMNPDIFITFSDYINKEETNKLEHQDMTDFRLRAYSS